MNSFRFKKIVSSNPSTCIVLTNLFSIFKKLQELLVFRLNLVDLFIQTFRVSTTQIFTNLFDSIDILFDLGARLGMLLLKRNKKIVNIHLPSKFENSGSLLHKKKIKNHLITF